MTLNTNAIQSLLCERLCSEVCIDQRPDGTLVLRTHFRFPDGDGYSIYLSETASGSLRLSDRGHTLMHISYEHDVDSFLDGTKGAHLERIVQEEGLNWEDEGRALCLDTSPEHLSNALFSFGQALTRVYDLAMLSRSNTATSFYDDLSDLLLRVVDEERVVRDYQPEVDNAQHYPVDYRIDGKSEIPLFIYGIPNRDKARLTTIMLSYFHLNELNFESILVFQDQSEIPRVDLARLSDVGGEMISSLASHVDLDRKLINRITC